MSSSNAAMTGLAGSLGVTGVSAYLDTAMKNRGVSEETRNAIINSFQMMYEYIPYCIEQKKDPTDAKVMSAFLARKGMFMAKYFGNDSVNCGLAIVDFILAAKAAQASNALGPVAWTMAYGMAMLNLIEVGNSCEPAQMAYYELFLRETSVKLQPVRSQVQSLHMP